MRLVKIEAVPGKRNSFSLLFQDETSLICGLGEIADFGLAAGMELEPDEYGRLSRACAYYRTRERAAALLSMRAMSSGELRQRLVEKGSSAEDAERAACWLEELGLLNDAEYAAAVARHYSEKGYGKGRIRDELYRRKVPRSLWDEALESVEACGDKLDALIARRLGGRPMDEKEKRRTADALRRRGFSWDEIKRAIGRYQNEDDYTED